MSKEGGGYGKDRGSLLERYLTCNEGLYALVDKVLLNVSETAEKDKVINAITVARALAAEVRESADEVSTTDNKVKLTGAEDQGGRENGGDAASDREATSKRSRKERAITEPATASGQQRILEVMAVMKDAYGALPKQFWGLSHAADLLAPRRLRVDARSFEIYSRQLLNQNAYPIVAVSISEPIFTVPGVKTVVLGDEFNCPVMLLEGTEELTFSQYSKFNQEITLPPGLKKVLFGRFFDRPVTLPASLRKAKFGLDFNHPLILSPRLKELHLGHFFYHPITLVEGLEVVFFGRWFNFPLTLPSTLKHLEFVQDSVFNHPIDLPSGLKTAVFGARFSKTLILPEGLESITVNENLPLTLPRGCKRIGIKARSLISEIVAM